MQYAKIQDNALVYPRASEFVGIPNYRSNEGALRRAGYMPVEGTPEEREGYYAGAPISWHVVEQSTTRIEPRQVTEDVYETNPETQERVKVGERTVMRDTEVTIDTSYIQLDEWEYTEIQEEEDGGEGGEGGEGTPVPPVISERDATERQIVALILQMAQRHDAINDIVQMEDITIPNLEALAVSKDVLLDGDEFRTLITAITPLKWQLEAIEDTTWARCWQGLKSRFPMYVEQILAEQQQSQE